MDAAVESLLGNLEKSGLLTPEQLADVRSSAERTSTPVALCRTLLGRGVLTRWQAAQLIAGRTSFFLGKYKLLELLGRGGMGNVYLAQHVAMNRRVALKLLSRSLDRDPVARARFFEEARTVAALDHPNIVRAYNVDAANDRHFMVMEYVDGRDLQRVVEEDGPLSYEAAVDAIRQAADGLSHAHARNMIHCDIKPANLLRNSQGIVKILDLGLARLTADTNGKASSDEKELGTVDYMSPEQALGVSFDHRADIYSLGCTLFFLLTGKPPFPEGTLHERILKHQTEQPRSILEARPTAPRALARICRKMMAKDPAERFQTAAEVSWAMSELNVRPELRRAVPLDQGPESDQLRPAGSSSTTLPAMPVLKRLKISRLQAAIIGGSLLAVLLFGVISAVALFIMFRVPAEKGPPGPGDDLSQLPAAQLAPIQPPVAEPVAEIVQKPSLEARKKGASGQEEEPAAASEKKPATKSEKKSSTDSDTKLATQTAKTPAVASDKKVTPETEKKPATTPDKKKSSEADKTPAAQEKGKTDAGKKTDSSKKTVDKKPTAKTTQVKKPLSGNRTLQKKPASKTTSK